MTETENQLENNFINALKDFKYEVVHINDKKSIEVNLKAKLEELNDYKIDNETFEEIKIFMLKGDNIAKAKKLRDGFAIRKNGKLAKTIIFFDSKDWCRNIFQVTNQVVMEGSRKNRYDVTILINGLPLIHCELKRRGGKIEEAINQINRYQKHSMEGWYEYVQIFIMSSGTDTVYCANNKYLDRKFTFRWADANNKKMNDLITEFTPTFLEQCQVAKMIAKYIIVSETDEKKDMLIMRPYQVHAVERIINSVHDQIGNGYVWHTTGSGKTLTSYKACELISDMEHVDKVLFIVDRNDLDTQTVSEYQKFQNSVSYRDKLKPTVNTSDLMKKLKNQKDNIIITTIQKLDRAVNKYRDSGNEIIGSKKVVLIFDECHRSQKGNMHMNIDSYFNSPQKFGFTGTPILEENIGEGFHTTEFIFGQQLHTYLIHEAIADKNVLGFSVDEKKVSPLLEAYGDDINISKLPESEEIKRCRTIASDIIDIHYKKTYKHDYNAILAVKSVKSVIQYYDLFKEFLEIYEDEHGKKLRIGAIFSSTKNEKNDIGEEANDEALERIINDYNELFKDDKNASNCSIEDVRVYNQQIAHRVKNNEIDILIVCSMFLTGFDAKCLNTIYLDKDLQYHTMLQAISRTNRVTKKESKTYGQVVCYHPNNRRNIDKAIALFADENSNGIVLMESYEFYIKNFNSIATDIKKSFPTVKEVLNEQSEEKKFKFAKQFKELLKCRSALTSFREFEYDDSVISEKEMTEYISAYQKVKTDIKDMIDEKDEDEIPEEWKDFNWSTSLLSHDIVNYDYIVRLIGEVASSNKKTRDAKINEILNDPKLIDYKDLVREFFDEIDIESFENSEDFGIYFMEYIERYQNKKISKIENDYEIQSNDLLAIIQTKEYHHDKFKTRVRNLLKSYNVEGEVKKFTTRIQKNYANEIENKVNKINEYLQVFYD